MNEGVAIGDIKSSEPAGDKDSGPRPMVNIRLSVRGYNAEKKLATLPQQIEKLSREIPGLNFVDVQVDIDG